MTNNVSAGELIFSRLFPVKIPNKFLHDEKTMLIKNYGVMGDPELLSQFRNEYTTELRTINNVLVMFDEGVITHFENFIDYADVYDILTDHLNDWAAVMQNPIRTQQPPPAKDFLLIETYLEFIREIAVAAISRRDYRKRLKDPTYDGTFVDNFKGIFGGGVFDVPATPEPVTPKKEISPGGYFADVYNSTTGRE